MNIHKTMTLEKWSGFSKGQQVLMIANEINRAKNILLKNNSDDINSSYERALDLIDITVQDIKWKSNLKEMLRCREFIGLLYCERNSYLNDLLLNNLILLSSEAYNLLNKNEDN
jgi:hypothetical protein